MQGAGRNGFGYCGIPGFGKEDTNIGLLGRVFRQGEKIFFCLLGRIPNLIPWVSPLGELFRPGNKEKGHPIFEGFDPALIVRPRHQGDEVLQSGPVRSDEEGQPPAGFGRGLQGLESFRHWDAADMDRYGLGEIKIGDDLETGLSGEGPKDRDEGLVFIIQSDRAPPPSDPDSDPDKAE